MLVYSVYHILYVLMLDLNICNNASLASSKKPKLTDNDGTQTLLSRSSVTTKPFSVDDNDVQVVNSPGETLEYEVQPVQSMRYWIVK